MAVQALTSSGPVDAEAGRGGRLLHVSRVSPCFGAVFCTRLFWCTFFSYTPVVVFVLLPVCLPAYIAKVWMSPKKMSGNMPGGNSGEFRRKLGGA